MRSCPPKIGRIVFVRHPRGCNMTTRQFLGLAAAFVICSSASAQTVLFQDNFDTNTSANWQVNIGGGGAAANNFANFAFNYSTIGIPAAPGGSTTSGLQIFANAPQTGVAG